VIAKRGGILSRRGKVRKNAPLARQAEGIPP